MAGNFLAARAPMLKRLSLQAIGKKVGQYGGNQLSKQSYMPKNPWILPVAKAVIGFAGAVYGKGDVIVPIAEGVFQSAIEDAIDQVAYMTGVPVEKLGAGTTENENTEPVEQPYSPSRVMPPTQELPSNRTDVKYPPLKIPGVNGAYDDPHEAMMAAIEDMVSDDYPRSNNYSNYMGTLDIVEGVQEEPSISS
jgi:hypothetical protein